MQPKITIVLEEGTLTIEISDDSHPLADIQALVYMSEQLKRAALEYAQILGTAIGELTDAD